MDGRLTIIFVHGLFSSGATWDRLAQLVHDDGDMGDVDILRYEYPTPKVSFSPARSVPTFDDAADGFATFMKNFVSPTAKIVIVCHSQGGLIVQRFLSRSIQRGLVQQLERIELILMFACPNAGSEFFITFRKSAGFWRNTHERSLRPLNREVTEARSIVLQKIVYADPEDPKSLHIPIVLYAGDSDGIVSTSSARDGFPPDNTGVLPGDHFSIIKPTSKNDAVYKTLCRHLADVRARTSAKGIDSSVHDRQVDSADTDVSVHVERAERYLAQGLIAQARAAFQNAIATDNIVALERYSKFLRRIGESDKSINVGYQIIDLLAQKEDCEEYAITRSRVMSSIGITLRKMGKFRDSSYALREAVEAASGDSRGELKARAYAIDNLAHTADRLGDVKGARQWFDEALTIRERAGNRLDRVHSLLNIARLETRLGELNAALERCNEAQSLLSSDDDRSESAAVYSALGEIKIAMEDIPGAEESFRLALKINLRTGRPANIALTQHQLAGALLDQGNIFEARLYAQQSLENNTAASNAEGVNRSRQLIARIAAASGDLELSIAMLTECAEECYTSGHVTAEAWARLSLADSLNKAGFNIEARVDLEKAQRLAVAIGSAALLVKIDELRLAMK
ncbi:alpha/beta fold hydrolase [Nocardia sp. NPDC055049]